MIEDGWVVLCFDAVHGREASLGYDTVDMQRVLRALDAQSQPLTAGELQSFYASREDAVAHLVNNGIVLGSAGLDGRATCYDLEPAQQLMAPATGSAVLGDRLTTWRQLQATGTAAGLMVDGLPPSVRRALPRLAEMEGESERAAANGESLVHFDVSEPNVIVDEKRVFLIDWGWGTIGAPWLDTATLLPSLGLTGEQQESLWRSTLAGRQTTHDDADSYLAGFAGHLLRAAAAPPSADAPALRHSQQAKALNALDWLDTRRPELALDPSELRSAGRSVSDGFGASGIR